MPSFSAASATLNRSASLIASLLNSVVYFLFSFGVGFLLMDHLWSKFTQFLRCPIFAEGIINHAGQLFRYFHVTAARFGVLTNGLIYRFFTDLEQPNKMDEKPF